MKKKFFKVLSELASMERRPKGGGNFTSQGREKEETLQEVREGKRGKGLNPNKYF